MAMAGAGFACTFWSAARCNLPARLRAEWTVEAGCHLLQYTGMTGAQIAERLGYADEYHFSRRFKQLRGETPTQFRRHLLR